MFGLSFSHLILFGVIALIVVGPEQLPEVARTIARFLNELRRASSDLGQHLSTQIDYKADLDKINEAIKAPIKESSAEKPLVEEKRES